MKLGVTFMESDLYVPQTAIPFEYAAQLDLAAPGITEKIVEQQANGESWFDSLARLLPIVAATAQQKQLLDVQTERARQGLPPLDVSQYSAGAKVSVGVSPELQKMLMLGGVALLGMFYLMRKGR